MRGGNVYGYYPDLDPAGVWSTPGSSRGRWIPTCSVEQFTAPLAKWLDVGDAELATIFPNLDRFSSPFGSAYSPSGYDSMLANPNMDYLEGI